MGQCNQKEEYIPTIQGWFEGPSENAHLIGSKCKSCGEVFFPKTLSCRNSYCESTTEAIEDVPLSRKGILWSYSVNYYPPPVAFVDPKNFKPYAVGIVELEDEKIRIAGRISSSCNSDILRIGMKMELVLEALYKNDMGIDIVTWMWKTV